MKIKRIINTFPAWTFTILVIIAILYLTLMPQPLPELDIPLFPGADKVVHGIMMMGMMICIGIDLARHKRHASPHAPKSKLLLALILTILFGGAIELTQGAMNMGRGEDIYDFLADAVGALAGFLIIVTSWGLLSRWMRDA